MMYKFFDLFNRSGWDEWITVDNLTLMAKMKICREATVISYRDKLIEAGLIEYKKGKKGMPNRYRLTCEKVVYLVVKPEVESVVKPEVESVDLYKNKPRQNKNIVPPISPKKKIFAEFAGENVELMTALQDFEAMRNAIKKPMTDRARQLMLKQLQDLSMDPKTQIAILEQSISRSWAGVFPLRSNTDSGQSKNASSYDLSEFEKLGYDIPEV